MSDNLMRASNEWANRPDDERYWNLADAYAAAEMDRVNSANGLCKASDLQAVVEGDDVLLSGERMKARLTNWSFGQLCIRANAPADYLAGLTPDLAAKNLNHGLHAENGKDKDVQVLIQKKLDGLTARSINSPRYERLWDSTFLRGFMELESKQGWRTPPARPAAGSKKVRLATDADVLEGAGNGLSIKVGDEIGPAGIYRGDRDMFIFMIDDDHVVEDGPNDRLARGFFFWNSEVGAKSFGAMTFLYRSVCGNHIVWDSRVTSEIRFRHVGELTQQRARRILEVEVKKYLEQSTADDVQRIQTAKYAMLGDDKDEVVNKLFGIRSLGIGRKVLESAFDSTTEVHPVDGDPRSAWGMANGVTRISQSLPNQDVRAALDAKAGKILEFAF